MRHRLAFLLALTLLSSFAFAEVKDSGAGGFTLNASFAVIGAPGDIYKKIVSVGEWWDSAHTYSADAHNMGIDAKAGGCWCEKLPKGGSVAHMMVATAWPGTLLVMTGGLGPLQQMGASGAMTFRVTAAGDKTRVDFTYAVSGYSPGGMQVLAPVVDKVLMENLDRLHRYLETGNPAGTRK